MTYTTQILHLDIMGIQISIKGFLGDLKQISSLCLYILPDDEDINVLYDAYDT